VRLYCFPYAGGSANVFMPWKQRLDPSIELAAVELPGRGRRFGDRLCNSFEGLLEGVVRELTRAGIATEYALLGHSFGGLLAFETARELMARGYAAPAHLFVSASCAPQRVREALRSLSAAVSSEHDDRDLLRSLTHLGGTPGEILADDEAVKLFAPIVRADLKALDSYRFAPKGQLQCNVSILLASRDTVAGETDAELWGSLTTGKTTTRRLDGGHFAAFERPDEVVSYINASLASPWAQAATVDQS
jgi:surfactin synthase thioesterase subunit